MKETGPNDADSVVWAIGEFFLISFFDTNLYFRVPMACNLRNQGHRGTDKGHGPKRRRPFGPSVSFFFFMSLSFFLILTHVL